MPASPPSWPPALPLQFPELDCVRDLLPARIITAAEQRAQSIGLGAEQVLICADAITEEAYLSALAGSLGTVFQPLDAVSRGACPLSDAELIHAAAAGLLPLLIGGKLTWIIAPRCLMARNLADSRQSQPKWLSPYRLTSTEQLSRFVLRYGRAALGRHATNELNDRAPLLSNAPREKGKWSSVAVALVLLAAMALGFAPAATISALGWILSLIFLATAALRLWSVVITDTRARWPRRIADHELPIYTVICALYREAAVAQHIAEAIRALDYPPEKLDIKFVLEADDADTRRAFARLELGSSFEILVVPAIGPRTKPKALNVALSLARGTYTVVFDAEDTPDPDQLRRAVATFRANDGGLACVQAALTIDNTGDSWLTRGIMTQTPLTQCESRHRPDRTVYRFKRDGLAAATGFRL